MIEELRDCFGCSELKAMLKIPKVLIFYEAINMEG